MSHGDIVLEIPELWCIALPLLEECCYHQQWQYVIYKALRFCELLYYSQIHGSPGPVAVSHRGHACCVSL